MAPPKSTGGGGDKGKSTAVVATSTRQTRSMDRQTRSQTQARGGGGGNSKLFNFESPEKRKRKAKAKEGGAAATKKVKKEKEEAVEEDDAAASGDDEGEEEEEEASETKTIVIEHCKQHKSFKERAKEVKEGLEKAAPGIIVTLNPDKKPRRGCFEIREEGGETFISLLDMKKPFTQMTELDMDEVVGNIVERIK